MAKKRSTENQIKALPEYGELISLMQNETASIITDYIRQYVGVASKAPEPGSGIFMNFDRVLTSQAYQELAWYDLYAEVERDTHVSSVLQSAKLNVAGMKYDIIPFKMGQEKQASLRNVAIAHFVKDALKRVGYFPQHLYNMMDALGKGFSASEIVWEVTDDGIQIKQILNRPQRRIQFDAVTRTPKVRNLTNPYYGDPFPEKKVIIHKVTSTWDNPFGDALDQSIYWMWLFKRMVMKFYMQHLEVGAASVPIVQHPASANAELKNEALMIAQTIRAGAYGRIPENFSIIWAEAKNAISNPQAYDMFIRLVNDEISKCVNGQTLTTEASSSTGAGSMALGNVHQGTQTSRDMFRAEGLASTLNHTLIEWLVDFNFGKVDGYPEFRFDLEESTDLEMEARIVKTLSDAGYNIPEEELSEKFNYTITKKEIKKIEPLPIIPTEEPENVIPIKKVVNE